MVDACSAGRAGRVMRSPIARSAPAVLTRDDERTATAVLPEITVAANEGTLRRPGTESASEQSTRESPVR